MLMVITCCVLYCCCISETKNVAVMSKDELLTKLKLIRAQTDATVEFLNNATSQPFSMDDEYEADYLIGCLQSNSAKLCSLVKKCQPAAYCGQQERSIVTEQAGSLLSASVSSAADDVSVNRSATASAVIADNVDSDDTASMDSSVLSMPICDDSVSI